MGSRLAQKNACIAFLLCLDARKWWQVVLAPQNEVIPL